MVKKLLTKDPLKRPTLDQLLEYSLIQRFTTSLLIPAQTDPLLHSLITFQPDAKPLQPPIKSGKEFIYLRDEDFPPPCFDDKKGPETFDPIVYIHQDEVSDEQKQRYMLLSKIKKRQRFELVRDFRYIGLNRVAVPVQLIKEIEDLEREEEERKEKEFEEKIEMPRKTKGVC